MMVRDLDVSVQEVRSSRFEDFYAASWMEVFRPLAATLGNGDLATEAVDEAMVRAYVRWPRVRTMGNPVGWVYRVAYRWSIDQLRRRSTERRVKWRLISGPETQDPVVEPQLAAALEALPVGQRAVVVLSCVFDWSHREIAEVLEIRPGTVKSRLHRGLEQLREELGA